MTAAAAQRCDVAIVGGGMVGASLALALAGTRLNVQLIEAVPPGSDEQPSFDQRSTALGNGARQILSTLGVWDQIAPIAAPIRAITRTKANAQLGSVASNSAASAVMSRRWRSSGSGEA